MDVSLIGPARAELPRVNGAAGMTKKPGHYLFFPYRNLCLTCTLPVYSGHCRTEEVHRLPTRSIKCSKPHRHRRLLFACKRRTPLNSKTLSLPPPVTSNLVLISSVAAYRALLAQLLHHFRHDQGFVNKFTLAMEGVSEGQLTVTSDERFPFLPAKLTTH